MSNISKNCVGVVMVELIDYIYKRKIFPTDINGGISIISLKIHILSRKVWKAL